MREENVVAISVDSGHEKQVVRDVLDLLFPYDVEVRVTGVSRGRVSLVTRIPAEDLRRIFRRYPVRHILKVKLLRKVLPLSSEVAQTLREIVSFFLEEGVKIRRISVRLEKVEGWSQSAYSMLMRELRTNGLLDSGGSLYAVETDGRAVFVFEVLFTRNPRVHSPTGLTP